ncbi:MAG: hypothetical protein AB7S36_15900, partial [Planctomycetota bacterium]
MPHDDDQTAPPPAPGDEESGADDAGSDRDDTPPPPPPPPPAPPPSDRADPLAPLPGDDGDEDDIADDHFPGFSDDEADPQGMSDVELPAFSMPRVSSSGPAADVPQWPDAPLPLPPPVVDDWSGDPDDPDDAD